MKCPKCTDSALRSVSAAPDLGGAAAAPRRCALCGGLWVSRSAVPALHESGVLEALDEEQRPDAEADKRNGLCPEGHGIMARARVSWEEPYFVERCKACDGIWLDAGEWSRLSSDLLLDELDELWLPSWRRRLQNEHTRKQLETDLEAKLGPKLFSRARELGLELAEHEHGDAGLAFVRELVRRHRRRIQDGD
jgi:hypothetical protein